MLFIDSFYLLNRPHKAPSPLPFSLFPNCMFPCVRTLLEKRKRTDSWVEQQLWPTKHNHKTFPDSEWGKCRRVSLGTEESILKLKFTCDPGQAGLSWGLTFQNRDWPARGAILTADYQATNATQSWLLLIQQAGHMRKLWPPRLYCISIGPKPPGFWFWKAISKQWKTWHLKYTQTAHMQLMSPKRQKTHTSVGNGLIWFQASLNPRYTHGCKRATEGWLDGNNVNTNQRVSKPSEWALTETRPLITHWGVHKMFGAVLWNPGVSKTFLSKEKIFFASVNFWDNLIGGFLMKKLQLFLKQRRVVLFWALWKCIFGKYVFLTLWNWYLQGVTIAMFLQNVNEWTK